MRRPCNLGLQAPVVVMRPVSNVGVQPSGITDQCADISDRWTSPDGADALPRIVAGTIPRCGTARPRVAVLSTMLRGEAAVAPATAAVLAARAPAPAVAAACGAAACHAAARQRGLTLDGVQGPHLPEH
jgi:hypothetical protein